jgi:glycosyltransferase involved in cell wall biosynthesis
MNLDGEVYHWSKHHEFLKFLDLPQRTRQAFELALSSYEQADCEMLEARGWRVRRALDFSTDPEAYRQYIADSRGEWTVAKDQNVRLRSGWFSDRAATYLAAGRPVVTQETGFGNLLPTGCGLFGFSTTEEAAAAIEEINSDYARHSRRASEIAREEFEADKVLAKLIRHAGVSLPA